MQLTRNYSTAVSPPEWLVSNGSVTVGPVRTELLLRGVMHGRVPTNAWVRQTGWRSWREVGKIREVSALKRLLDRALDGHGAERLSLRDCGDAVAQARDPSEALLIALQATAQATFATVGLVHRVRAPLLLPTTSCVFSAPSELLGEVVPWFDPAFALARVGGFVLGRGDAGVVERALSARLGRGAHMQGVAMFPIQVAGQLCGLLELGRSDHPFRVGDGAELAEFAHHVGAALTRLTCCTPSRPSVLSS
jgi:hypothetical protein